MCSLAAAGFQTFSSYCRGSLLESARNKKSTAPELCVRILSCCLPAVVLWPRVFLLFSSCPSLVLWPLYPPLRPPLVLLLSCCCPLAALANALANAPANALANALANPALWLVSLVLLLSSSLAAPVSPMSARCLLAVLPPSPWPLLVSLLSSSCPPVVLFLTSACPLLVLLLTAWPWLFLSCPRAKHRPQAQSKRRMRAQALCST